MSHSIRAGAAAGAAGTTALNAVTYLDMAVRGRGPSEVPQSAVERIADRTDTRIPGDDTVRGNRVSALGPLMGLATGVGVGVAYGVARSLGWRPALPVAAAATAAAAMAGSDVPLTALGLTDPRSWRPGDWLADVVPHLAYGVVTAASCAALERGAGGRSGG